MDQYKIAKWIRYTIGLYINKSCLVWSDLSKWRFGINSYFQIFIAAWKLISACLLTQDIFFNFTGGILRRMSKWLSGSSCFLELGLQGGSKSKPLSLITTMRKSINVEYFRASGRSVEFFL